MNFTSIVALLLLRKKPKEEIEKIVNKNIKDEKIKKMILDFCLDEKDEVKNNDVI